MRRLLPSKWLASTLSFAPRRFASIPSAHFFDDFEKHAPGQVPGAPWKGRDLQVRCHHPRRRPSTRTAANRPMHVTTPRGANYRRGYVAIHLRGPLPQLQAGMYGRTMVWLDTSPKDAGCAARALDAAAGRGPFGRRSLQFHLSSGPRAARRHAVHGEFRDHAAGDHRFRQQSKRYAARAPLGLRGVALRYRLERNAVLDRWQADHARAGSRLAAQFLSWRRSRRPMAGAAALRQPLHGLRALRRQRQRPGSVDR